MIRNRYSELTGPGRKLLDSMLDGLLNVMPPGEERDTRRVGLVELINNGLLRLHVVRRPGLGSCMRIGWEMQSSDGTWTRIGVRLDRDVDPTEMAP